MHKSSQDTTVSLAIHVKMSVYLADISQGLAVGQSSGKARAFLEKHGVARRERCDRSKEECRG